ncbi:MAG: primosomal protein N' [Actinomycetota bacterium]|nr:primosomal protein N' [Actinomycetota bacterium]
MISGDSVAEASSRASVIPLLPIWRVDRPFDYLVPPELEDRIEIGRLVRVRFGKRNVRGIVVGLAKGLGDRELAPISAVIIDVALAPEPLDRLFEWLARRYGVARGVAYARVVPPRVRFPRPDPVPLRAAEGHSSRLAEYEGGRDLMEAISSGGAGVWSIRALPGEDRGRLISELVDAAAGTGGAALVAVPEVRYGSSILDSLAQRRPELARVDSNQPEGDRSRGWVALASGHGLGGGGRASVLAPAPALRLLVLDEEHHHSYKEDRSPRYDARRVAVERARLQGAVCVLISATPPLETALAVRRGRWQEVVAPRSLRRAARPIVEVVEPAPERSLTSELHDRVRDTLRGGGKIGLLVPSRGYSRALWCASCRRSLRCPACEAGLFYDRAGQGGPTVRCSRCGFRGGAPDTCPTCASSDWRYLGAGSERLAEQIARSFPRASVQRMDPDVLAREDFRSDARPDIYVTTWIGTKPALRPDVALVGVLDGDALIRRPDFRAAESAYQAFSEMAEWAGPASRGGRLVIQCSEPAHHAVQAVVRADHDFFVERELEQRRELGYPPFRELVKVGASGPRAKEVIEEAAVIARKTGARVLGPIAVRVAGPDEDPSQEILVKVADALVVADALRPLLAATPAGELRVDVDPR